MDSRINSGKVFPIQGNGFQLVGHSWMPTTPEKCITTRSDPAVADMQGSQSNRMDLPGWDAVHSGFIQMWNSNEAVYNNEMGRSGTNFMEDASLPYRYDLMTTGVSRVAQPASANTMVGRNMSMDGRALTPNSHPQVSNQRDSMVGRIHSSISRPPHINCSSPQATQHGFQAPYTTCIDLNLPLTEADVTSNATTSSQFIPATPNQGKTLEGTPSVIVNLPEKCRNEEKGKLKNIFLPRERKANHSNIELLHTVLDSSLAVNPTALVKPTDLDRGSDRVIDLNQTPQHKPPKPRKHRPKVIVVGKPKRAPKPSTSVSTNSKENPTGKRKYMRKSLQESRTRRTDSAEKFANPSTGKRKYTLKKRLEEHPIQCENLKWGTTYPRTQTGKRRCVRKKILGESPIIYEDSVGMTPNFNAGKKFGHQVAPIQHADANRDDTAYCVPGTSVKSCRRMLHIESENTGGMHNLKESLNSSFGFESLKLVGAENLGKRKSISQGNQQNSSLLENQQSVVLSNLRNFPKHVPSDHTPISDVQITAAQLDLLHTTRMNLNGIENKTTETGEQVQREVPTLFPAKSDCKSHERTKQIEHQIDPRLEGSMSSFSFESRELLTELYSSEYRSLCSENPGGASLLCQEKIQVEGYRRNSKISSSYEAAGKLQARGSSTLSISIQPEKVKMPQPQKGVLEDHRQSSAKRGRPSQQKHNQIEGVSYKPVGASINNQKNALVSYKKDGTVVPYVVSVKRKSKPKVNLDPETERVWKLLMGKEGSEGLEGSDKVKEQWWQNEREGLRLRVESFIERMHLIQGNRRFSKWKGSVVDSVIGVFLTQNVSDHLSSSAFMVLASKFPLKSRKNRACDRGKRSVVVEEPDDCTLDLNDTIKNCEEITFSVCNGSSTTNPTSTIMFEGEDHCTGEEVISLQDSVITQTSERVISYSGSNSETGDLASGHRHNRVDNLSYMELLTSTDAELNKIHNLSYMELLTTTDPLDEYCSISESLLFEEGSGDGHEEADMKSALQGSSFQNFINMDCPYVSNISRLRDSVSPSIAYMLQPTIQHIVQEAEVLRIPGEASTSSWSSTVCAVTKEIHANCTCKRDGHEIPILHFCQPSACQGSNSISYHSQSHEWNNDMQLYSTPTGEPHNHAEAAVTGQNIHRPPIPKTAERFKSFEELTHFINNSVALNSEEQVHFTGVKNIQASANTLKTRRGKVEGEKKDAIDWDSLRKQVPESRRKARNEDTIDSLDYEALRSASVEEIADAIKERGMNKMLAERIKEFLDRVVNDHGSIDLEWLRDVPPDKAKEYLLSMRGLGLKSVECVRLLTLHHLAFPVDTNVGRVAVRLGWVPLQPLPESVQLHLLTLYPILETVQKYLWPRLCKLDQQTLYELHYQMITFGKVFCTKERPNCNACPMRAECKHFASAFASARLALPGPEEKSVTTSMAPSFAKRKPDIVIKDSLPLPPPEEKSFEARTYISSCVPIIEEPSTPDHDEVIECYDIEDSLLDDLEDIPTIEFSAETFKRNVEDCVQGPIDLKAAEMSSALVVVHQDAASIRHPKLKFVSRLRTEHLVYELPDSHPLLKGMESREPDDPSPYLLAIWAPGETANSTRSSEPCQSQERGKLCHSKTCFSCNGIREADSQIVRGTILIPCRTAMRGSFPLNGTYFQVNEVFADHESSYNPIDVPRNWIWNLRRRIAYFGTSVSTIVRGLSTEAIQYCFWKGFVCVRGFDQEQRVPKPLALRLHRPPSKVATDQES